MAKLANRGFPADLEPQEAEEIAGVLVNDFGGEANNEEAFAQAIGHKTTNSGTYMRKIGDARKYGIITPRGLEATDLGFRIANPRDESDRQGALFQMLQNVELLKDLYADLNGNDPPDQLWRVLREITDANPKEARDAEDRIRELYQAMLRSEPEEPESDGETEERGERGQRDEEEKRSGGEVEAPAWQSQSPPEVAIFVMVGNDEMRFQEMNDVNIELAQQFLESKKANGEAGIQMRLD